MTNTLMYNNKIYQVVKWLVQVVLPAAAVLYLTLGQTWNWPNTESVAASITGVTAFLGITLGISSHNYNKDNAATPLHRDVVALIVGALESKLRASQVEDTVIEDIKQEVSTKIETQADGVINVNKKPNGDLMYDLRLNQDPVELQNMSKVVFNVRKKG